MRLVAAGKSDLDSRAVLGETRLSKTLGCAETSQHAFVILGSGARTNLVQTQRLASDFCSLRFSPGGLGRASYEVVNPLCKPTDHSDYSFDISS